MPPKSSLNDVDQLSLFAVKLARVAPELVPAFVWLVATGGHSKRVKAFRQAKPSTEELAALVAYLGEPAREIMSDRKAIGPKVTRSDLTKNGMLAARFQALKRLGLGVEALVR